MIARLCLALLIAFAASASAARADDVCAAGPAVCNIGTNGSYYSLEVQGPGFTNLLIDTEIPSDATAAATTLTDIENQANNVKAAGVCAVIVNGVTGT